MNIAACSSVFTRLLLVAGRRSVLEHGSFLWARMDGYSLNIVCH